MSSALTISNEESGTGSEAAVLEQSVVHSAGGGSAAAWGTPWVTPPSPSANATADIEATRRQVAKNLVSFVIVLFVLFIERSLA